MNIELIKKMQVSCHNCSLETVCIPRGLNHREVEEINLAIKRRNTLQRGDFIYRNGDPFKGLIAIKSGVAKLVADDRHGNEHILNILLPGELVGFDGLFDDQHNCSAVALDTLSYCELPADQLETLGQKVPSLMRELFRHTGHKINDDRNMIVISQRPAEERLAAFLISLSERFNQRGFSATEFNLPLTRQEIGNHLGLALETVSRLLKQLQNANFITVRNKNITIEDIDGLKKLFTQE